MTITSHAQAGSEVYDEDPLVVVASYNSNRYKAFNLERLAAQFARFPFHDPDLTLCRFDNLAHVPRGTAADAHTLRVYRLHRATGALTLLSVDKSLENPAFLRFHPEYNVLYACTEDITKDNVIACFNVSPTCGKLTQLGTQSAMGKSTCYLYIDIPRTHLLFVNYWDSVIGTMPLDRSGVIQPVQHKLEPAQRVVAQGIGDHLANRQSEPHAHAIVLDPYFGKVAFVPDLGLDVVRQHHYDESSGRLTHSTILSCGPEELKPHGPRYIAFHPALNMAYVVNELSSTVTVYEFNVGAARALTAGDNTPTLQFVQCVSTIPSAFPRNLNTCGRICVDPTGRFVLVSNRGHNSIAVFAINDATTSGESGFLTALSYCDTGGRTPRHFQFDPSGQFLLSANQDTDSITIFRFNNTTGELVFNPHTYDIPSPNFVCCFHPYRNSRRNHSRL